MTTTAIVLPGLTAWTEGKISAILKATSEEQFNEAFDSFVGPNASITLNGAAISREKYKAQLQAGKAFEAGASVKFDDAIEVPASEPGAGSVGLFYEATVESKFRILGGPESSTVTSSLNVVITQDQDIPAPKPPIRGDVDRRRVSKLSQVIVAKADPVHIP